MGALSLGPTGWLVVALPAAACLVAFLRPGRTRGLALAVTGNLTLALNVVLAGLGATRLLGSAPEFARVSVGGAGWLGLAAAGLVLFGAGLDLAGLDLAGLRPAARLALLWWGAVAGAAIALAGGLSGLSVAQEYAVQSADFRAEVGRHLGLAAAALGFSLVLGVPLGLLAARRPGAAGAVLGTASLLQTVPAVALLGLLIGPISALVAAWPWLGGLGVRGIGAAPALVALTLYGLLPIVRGTYTGLRSVSPAALEAGRGMGMTGGQLLARVQWPLALPLVLGGARVAAVQLVGLTALASLVGAGGLGRFIFGGLGSAANDLVLLGALPVLVLAVLTDRLFGLLERRAVPRGLRS